MSKTLQVLYCEECNKMLNARVYRGKWLITEKGKYPKEFEYEEVKI